MICEIFKKIIITLLISISIATNILMTYFCILAFKERKDIFYIIYGILIFISIIYLSIFIKI